MKTLRHQFQHRFAPGDKNEGAAILPQTEIVWTTDPSVAP